MNDHINRLSNAGSRRRGSQDSRRHDRARREPTRLREQNGDAETTEKRGSRGTDHRWSHQRSDRTDNGTAWQRKTAPQHGKENHLTDIDFPPLEPEFLDARFTTPENAKLDWGSRVEEEELNGMSRSKRKLLLSHEDNTRNAKRPAKPSKVILTDEHKLAQRQKQIDIGKNTVAYGRYIAAVSREKRRKGIDAITPDKLQMCSTRSWVGQIRLWRRRLHLWDPPHDSTEEIFTPSSQSPSSSQSMDEDAKMDSLESEAVSDIFKNFDLDVCLMNDGLPL